MTHRLSAHPAGSPLDPPTVPAARRPPRPAPTASSVNRLHDAQPGPPTPVRLGETQGSLALDLVAPGVPRVPGLRLVPSPRPAPPEELQLTDDVHRWATRFAQAVVEVDNGDRPVSQLLRWTSLEVYAELDERARRAARSRLVRRGPRQGPAARPQVRSVRVFCPTPDCVEVSVHVRASGRSRALAARLERVRDRWTCTVLETGQPAS